MLRLANELLRKEGLMFLILLGCDCFRRVLSLLSFSRDALTLCDSSSRSVAGIVYSLYLRLRVMSFLASTIFYLSWNNF